MWRGWEVVFQGFARILKGCRVDQGVIYVVCLEGGGLVSCYDHSLETNIEKQSTKAFCHVNIKSS